VNRESVYQRKMGEMAVSAERSGDLHKAKFIKVDVSPGHEQTMPVEPARRLSKSDIRLEECMRQDAEIIVCLFQR